MPDKSEQPIMSESEGSDQKERPQRKHRELLEIEAPAPIELGKKIACVHYNCYLCY